MELWGIYLTGDSRRDILQAGVKGRGQSMSQGSKGVEQMGGGENSKGKMSEPGRTSCSESLTVAGSRERAKDGQMELSLTLHCLHHVAVAFQSRCVLLLEKCQGLGPGIQGHHWLALPSFSSRLSVQGSALQNKRSQWKQCILVCLLSQW